jgi:PKD repeat protein
MIVTHAYLKSGTFTVTLTVTDNCGLTATDTTRVTVITPCQGISQLKIMVKDMHIKPVIETKLLTILDTDSTLCNKGWYKQAVSSMNSFVINVKAQRGVTLTNEQADQLISYANKIINGMC